MFKLRLSEKYKEYIVIITLIIIMIAFSILTDRFLTSKNLINVLRQVSMLGIVAVGVSFVMIAGGMDLSIGAVMSITCVSAAFLMIKVGIPPLWASLAALVLGTFCGFFNGIVGVWLNVHPLIVTLGTMIFIRGLSYAICGGLPINGLPEGFRVLGQGYLGPIPNPIIILFIIVLLGNFILNKTVFGRIVYAIGGSEEVARFSGIDTKKIKVDIYMISGFTAGLAGIIGGSRVNGGVPSTGTGYEFDVMTAAVLGGISIKGGEGKLSGVIFGVLIIGILSNGMSLLGLGDYYQSIIKGLVLLMAVAFDVLQRKPVKKKQQIATVNSTASTVL